MFRVKNEKSKDQGAGLRQAAIFKVEAVLKSCPLFPIK